MSSCFVAGTLRWLVVFDGGGPLHSAGAGVNRSLLCSVPVTGGDRSSGGGGGFRCPKTTKRGGRGSGWAGGCRRGCGTLLCVHSSSCSTTLPWAGQERELLNNSPTPPSIHRDMCTCVWRVLTPACIFFFLVAVLQQPANKRAHATGAATDG